MEAKSERLHMQIEFVLEIDKLKDVLRRSYLIGSGRRENSAEHSWHVAVLATVLAEHANEPVDVRRVVTMLLIHDIVEVDSGDTYAYDSAGRAEQAEREHAAADRLFGMLPTDQRDEYRRLWDEFNAAESADARFAAALDRLIPVLHNAFTAGRSWREHGITADQVVGRNQTIRDGSAVLWEYAHGLIRDAVAAGHLKPGREA